MFLCVEIFQFLRKIGKLFFLSLTSFNRFSQKINPISNYLLFWMLLNRFKIKLLITFPNLQDKVFSMTNNLSRFCIKIQKLINSSFLSINFKLKVMKFNIISSSLKMLIKLHWQYMKKSLILQYKTSQFYDKLDKINQVF